MQPYKKITKLRKILTRSLFTFVSFDKFMIIANLVCFSLKNIYSLIPCILLKLCLSSVFLAMGIFCLSKIKTR